MNIFEGFTRKEVIDLAGTTSNRLQYLERANLIIPIGLKRLAEQLFCTLGNSC